VVLDDQLQHHKKKLNALKHLTSGRKIVHFFSIRATHGALYRIVSKLLTYEQEILWRKQFYSCIIMLVLNMSCRG
ncbi:hypothetical protein, partial [Leuconostoc falkenbergense]|uniref:hypothetical protein n=1 Tax=Leuconostoc falkenbergense TaxID=2766470 RepID=UPI003BB1AA4E